MASGKTSLLAALCCLVILSTFISGTQSASCCLRYSRRLQKCSRMLGYTIQTINTSCDINAVIFHVPGRFICANPWSSWTQRAVKCLDARNRSAVEMTAGAQPTITPAKTPQDN